MNEELDELLRLQYDFEFIQHLLSADYVKYLFKKEYFDDKAFLNYLEYLKYWKQPDYMKLLVQPRCLDVLDMLLKEEVRAEISHLPDFANYLN